MAFDPFDDDNSFEYIDLKDNYFIEEEKKPMEYKEIQNIHFSAKTMIFNCSDENEIDSQTYFKTSSKKTKIFKIKKIKKRGRRKFGANISSKINHDKNSSDNIKQKIKRLFIQSVKDYLNSLYNKYFNLKNRKSDNFLKKIKTNFTSSLDGNKNLENFSMTLRELFSSDLGGKYTKMDKKYNKKNIDILIQKNEAKEIIKLLNKTLKEVYEIYINNEIPEFSLAHDLNIIEKKFENYYMNRYKEIASKLIVTYKKKGKNDSLNIEEDDKIIIEQ